MLPLVRRLAMLVVLASLVALTGCSGGHASRTRPMRTALDGGRYVEAVTRLDRALHVRNGELPTRLRGDDALLVLDRATIQQALASFEESKRDYQAADAALDLLDLSRNGSDAAGRMLYSDDAARYAAPPHEKLLLNTMNMLNYLETNALSGARVEARRLAVWERFFRDRGREDHPTLALGALLAGFAYEKSGHADEAARFYARAARAGAAGALASTPELPEGSGELLVVVGEGRAPRKVAERVPIGLALTRAAPLLAATDRDLAGRLATAGAVTWVSYPRLVSGTTAKLGPSSVTRASVGGQDVALTLGLDVEAVARAEWAAIEGEVMAAALSRTLARFVAGQAIEQGTKLSDDKGVRAVGALVSLFVQGALAAADTPDTRSWETAPARIHVARVTVPSGTHEVSLEARGVRRVQDVVVSPGGHAVVSLLALR